MDGPRHRNSPATRKLNYKDYSLRWVTTKATKSFAPDEPHNRVVSLMTSTILETKSSLLLKILLFLSHQIRLWISYHNQFLYIYDKSMVDHVLNSTFFYAQRVLWPMGHLLFAKPSTALIGFDKLF